MKAVSRETIPVVGTIMAVMGLIDNVTDVYDKIITAKTWTGERSPVAICASQQQAANYFKRLNVLGANATATVLGKNGQVVVTVYQYSTVTAYINWRQYCKETGSTITYEEFVQAMLNPEETPTSRAIMQWVNNMSGTVNVDPIRDAFVDYIDDAEFLAQYPEQDWPTDVDACTLEQLEILYNYHQRQRGE